jgi:hypothetical protein
LAKDDGLRQRCRVKPGRAVAEVAFLLGSISREPLPLSAASNKRLARVILLSCARFSVDSILASLGSAAFARVHEPKFNRRSIVQAELLPDLLDGKRRARTLYEILSFDQLATRVAHALVS